ncbi:MAG: hypothetical protein U1G07_02425 [Verrucomicrobiota bacterium]
MNARIFLAIGVAAAFGMAANAEEQPSRSEPPTVPDDFPRFIVPGWERQLSLLRELFWLHYQPAGPLIPLWDEWMPMSTLWPGRGSGHDLGQMQRRWAQALGSRSIDAEGYVETQQHDGLAHAGGWPFPLWTQAKGIGWHFRGTGVTGYDAPLSTPAGWSWAHSQDGGVTAKGWALALTAPAATLQTPAFTIAAKTAPWLRLNWWASGLDGANCYVEWTTAERTNFNSDCRFYFSPPPTPSRDVAASSPERRTMIPVYRSPAWTGTITGLRIALNNDGPAQVTIKSFHTACDTRHPINNLNFIRAVRDYVAWTGDLAFLREQIARVRTAMRFTMREFDTRQRKCIYTTWPGHEGRSGVRRTGDGAKQIVPGEGIGGNYWDLLPFGGEDALATIYYYDTLLDLATVEQQIRAHPEWGVSRSADAFDPDDLRRHAHEVRDYSRSRFWNPATGRFGTVDLDGVMHDYGWTFLNNEAVYYGLATSLQARSIRDWISGRRLVEGDTSTGEDIYHWRFGPRASTRRNLDYYFWGWSNPESIPWGYQVQDGGGVLGFSYHDLMCRLAVDGPDDTWERLQKILTWFAETEAEGGYRAYYAKDPSRGTMQGGNVPGGLGLDREFFESILVPQVMLYGFLGFTPTLTGFQLQPKLPSRWPELTVTRVHLRDMVMDVTAHQDGRVVIRSESDSRQAVEIELFAGGWQVKERPAQVVANRVTLVLPKGQTEFVPLLP